MTSLKILRPFFNLALSFALCASLVLCPLFTVESVAKSEGESDPEAATNKVHLKQPSSKPKKRSSSPRRQARAYFIPPPPAYMPSILPQSYLNQKEALVAEAAEKPENPYRKYVFECSGHEAKTPVNSRKGVVLWTKAN